MRIPLRRTLTAALAVITFGLVATMAQRGRGDNPFPGGANPDGSLRPTPPLTRLFTQDAYTEYAILKPGSEEFRIRFLPEETRVGATELVNATRGGSEGSGVEVYDPRTGKPLTFTYSRKATIPRTTRSTRSCRSRCREGGIGRVLIYKTYKDPRTYMMHGEDIVWVRSLSGYRLGVLLPKGFAFISSNVAAQLTTTSRRPAEAGVREPERPEQPGHDPRAQDDRDVPAARRRRHVLRRREDAVRPRGAGDADASRSSRPTATIARARRAQLDSLGVPAAAGSEGDRSRHRQAAARPRRTAARHVVKLDVPIADDKQSAHLKHHRHARAIPATRRSRRRAGVRRARCTACATPSCCRPAGRCRRCRSPARSAPTTAARSSR